MQINTKQRIDAKKNKGKAQDKEKVDVDQNKYNDKEMIKRYEEYLLSKSKIINH